MQYRNNNKNNMYTQHNLNVHKMAAKNAIKPELASVAFYGNRTVATDTWRLLEVEADGEAHEPRLYRADMVKAVKLKKGQKITEEGLGLVPLDGNYPDVDSVLNRTDGAEYTTITINGKLLAELLQVMAGGNKFSGVIMKVPTEKHRPLVLESYSGQKMRGLLMPFNR